MCSVVIADLFLDNCSGNSDSLQKRIQNISFCIKNVTNTHVYLLQRCSHDRCSVDPNGTTAAKFLEKLVGPKTKVHVLNQNSVAASLYEFKRAADQLDVNAVQVVTSPRHRSLLEAYQNILFTEVYSFEYQVTLEDCQCPFNAPDRADTELQEIRADVTNFLQQLPGEGNIQILRSSLISECFSHGFTTRTGGISYISTLQSLNLFSSTRRKDPQAVVAENIRRLGLQAGFDPKRFHLVKTNHGNEVWVMGKAEPERYDAIVTNQEGVVIAAPGADCMTLLFADPVAKVIGVAHAGWKGTLMGVAMATVNAMATAFRSRMADIAVAIGPSVGPCCFTLERPSAALFSAIHPACVRGGYVDIRLATRILLERGGVLPQHIHDDAVTDRPVVTLCTACHPDLFFSHVRDGERFGTQVAFLWIKGRRHNGHRDNAATNGLRS